MSDKVRGVQFFYVEDTPDLPVIFLNCGLQMVNSGRYFWHGRHRNDYSSNGLAIWQYTVSGCGSFTCDGQTHKLEAGSAFLVTVPDDHIYCMPEDADHWEFVFLTLSGSTIMDLTRQMQQKYGKVLNHSANSIVLNKTMEIINKYYHKPLPEPYVSSTMAYELWMLLASELNSQSTPQRQLLDAVVEYLQANPDKTACNVEELAESLGYSRAYFTRKFTQECGITPGKFMLDWRLRMAAQFLITEHSLIKEVAFRTGFADVSHFCRVFRQKYNLSPEHFRLNSNESEDDEQVSAEVPANVPEN